ncbi:glutamate carboxypeptidase [Novosphingobium sp. fls2-241-R2A-195]|uniref:glutamate carboxypeptidase n=1 Tax=Novosphingobium sp. fls2-241-R2A-195 TaxID=3040296 RepID=UPI00255169A5|nr:glutamate carboxypeptidase [Novosphingobium sp. fls2-241-R2A-195]
MRTKILAMTSLAVAAAIAPPAWAKAPSVPELKAASAVEEQAFLQTLEHLVDIDSGSDNAAGLSVAADYLSERLKGLGFQVSRLAAPPSPGSIVVGTLKGKGRRSFLLMAHYDTVYPAGTGRSWKYKAEGNRIHGPGALDAKSGIAMILSSLAVLGRLGFEDFSTITVLFNPDEETGSAGSRDIIARLASQHDFTLSAEPGGTQRLLATSGIARLTMTVTGTASHAGVAPEQGRNALVEASDIIARTRDWSLPDKGLKFNWTLSHSGQKANVIPDQAEASADIRYLQRTDVEALLSRLNDFAASPAVAGTHVAFAVDYSRPPLLPTMLSRRFAELARSAGDETGYPIKIVDQPFGGASDAAYAASSGKSAVVESFGLAGRDNHAIYKEYAERDGIVPGIYVMSRSIVQAGADYNPAAASRHGKVAR